MEHCWVPVLLVFLKDVKDAMCPTDGSVAKVHTLWGYLREKIKESFVCSGEKKETGLVYQRLEPQFT